MAFIRQFADESGDPFRFRLPRAIRKFQPGRAIKRFAPIAAALIPGAGAALDMARGFGLNAGDDLLSGDAYADPLETLMAGDARRGAKRSKPKASAHTAASHAHAHAAAKSKGKKKTHHLKHAVAHAGAAINAGASFAEQHPGISSLIEKSLGGIPIAGGALEELAHQAQGVGGLSTVPNMSILSHPGARAHGFGHHRKTNPLNLRALNRASRRLEGFEKVVRRVMPKLFSGHGHSHARRSGKKLKGHKHGCACVGCRAR